MSTEAIPTTPRPGRLPDAERPAEPDVAAGTSEGGSLLRRWLAGWASITLLVTSVLTAPIALAAWIFLLVAIVSITGAGIGIILTIPALWFCGVLGHAERHRVSALTGATIHPPLPPVGQPVWQRLFLDRHCWRSAAYLVLHSMWGLAVGLTALVVLAHTLVLLALPLYLGLVPDSGLTLLYLLRVDGPIPLTMLWLSAVAMLLVLPFLARLASSVDVMMARWLLGRDERKVVEQLTARVDTLTETRKETVDSVEAERRRIERDLHDGPQQRLVAIAMSLGMAKEAIRHDPDAAAELVDEAHASAKEAIVEMRHVARGIVPPVLADRGLDAALSALAARSTVPVEVRVRDIGRIDPTAEAIAYFVVSEALTNVAKHSGASRATVDVGISHGATGPLLALTVSDDGQGGADPTRGTGLTGLRQRVGSIDGELLVTSPEGGPTTLVATLPLRQVPGSPPPAGPPPAAPTDLATRYLRPGRSQS